MRHLFAVFGILTCVFCQAQVNRQYVIRISPGRYSATEVIDSIRAGGVQLSYANSAVYQQEIVLDNANPVLHKLLSMLFDEQAYRFIYRKNKVIISPILKEQTRNLNGYVEEKESGERLVGAHVYIPSLNIGTTTNAFGYFSLTVDVKDTLLVIASSLGYKNEKRWVYSTENPVDFSLQASPLQLPTVEINARVLTTDFTQMSEASFSPEFAKGTPAFLGEVDILKTVQTLPGVQVGTEGTAGLIVRGGSPDQNLLLLDGVPVYNASHLFGFFSVFNAEAIKSISLIKGGFPARFGGRLSSVLSIDMKEGNLNEYHGSGSIGLVASRLMLEGPIIKNKMSFMLSGRRTYWDLIARAVNPNIPFNYFFNDVNAKLNYLINEKDRLYLSFYSGRDALGVNDASAFGVADPFDVKWGNRTVALRWNRILNETLFGNLTATYSRYRFLTGSGISGNGAPDFSYKSAIEDYGLKYDFEWQQFVQHKSRFGLNYTYHQTSPGIFQTEELNQQASSSNINAHDLYIYAEDDWAINARWKVNAGLHYSVYYPGGKLYHYLQPRLAARYSVKQNWSLKASYANMAQPIHLLTNQGVGLPTDLWVSSTANVAPQRSEQLAFGSFHHFGGGKWEVSGEVYYKWLSNLIAYKNGASYLTSGDWENAIETHGLGRAYGMELFLKRLEGKTTGWISYTLSKSERQFENINRGAFYPFKYDRRHNISIVFNHRFSEKFELGVNWVYATGQAFSLPTSTYYLIDPNTGGVTLHTDYASRNSLRYPAYHRLDLSAHFKKRTRWGQRTWSVGLYNAYNRQNPFYLEVVTANNQNRVEQLSLFPIIPSITYGFEF